MITGRLTGWTLKGLFVSLWTSISWIRCTQDTGLAILLNFPDGSGVSDPFGWVHRVTERHFQFSQCVLIDCRRALTNRANHKHTSHSPRKRENVLLKTLDQNTPDSTGKTHLSDACIEDNNTRWKCDAMNKTWNKKRCSGFYTANWLTDVNFLLFIMHLIF